MLFMLKVIFYLLRKCMSPMFIAALFTIAKSWKQPRCPATDEWIKKICYLYTGISLSHEKE
jgi:hypothetical protein